MRLKGYTCREAADGRVARLGPVLLTFTKAEGLMVCSPLLETPVPREVLEWLVGKPRVPAGRRKAKS